MWPKDVPRSLSVRLAKVNLAARTGVFQNLCGTVYGKVFFLSQEPRGSVGSCEQAVFWDRSASCHSCGPPRVPGILQLAEGRQRRKSVTAAPNTVFPSCSTDLRLDLVIWCPGLGREAECVHGEERNGLVSVVCYTLFSPGNLQSSWFLPVGWLEDVIDCV